MVLGSLPRRGRFLATMKISSPGMLAAEGEPTENMTISLTDTFPTPSRGQAGGLGRLWRGPAGEAINRERNEGVAAKERREGKETPCFQAVGAFVGAVLRAPPEGGSCSPKDTERRLDRGVERPYEEVQLC